MTAFSEQEQYYSDLDWFAVDKDGKIGHFTTGGDKLLPPTISSSKENWKKLLNYFEQLEAIYEFEKSPDLEKHLSQLSFKSLDKFLESYKSMSSRGLYSFNSYPSNFDKNPYFLVTFPKIELTFESLPGEIRLILQNQRLKDVSFDKTFLIQEEVLRHL